MVEKGVRLHPFYKLLQSKYPEKLVEAELSGRTICLPDPRNTRELPLSEDFISAHILTEEDGGFFSSSDGVVSVESCPGSSGWPETLKLLEGPDYHPSYARGLHCAAVQETVQASPDECKMLLLDRPLLPLYCRMGSKCSRQTRGQEVSPRPSSGRRLARQAGIDEKEEVHPLRLPWLPFINPKTARPSSCPSQNPRASTAVTRLTVPSAAPTPRSLAPTPASARKTSTPPPRQVSADSGIDPDMEDSLFDLPPRMTSFCESESFLVAQPCCTNFSLHLQRLLGPLAEELSIQLAKERGKAAKIPESGKEEQREVLQLSGRVRRLCQESVIAFPKSPGGISRSPRYQESIRIAVENAVLWMLQPVLVPLLRVWSKARDRTLHQKLSRLWRRGYSPDLREDLASIPLPAALVELAALGQHSTVGPTLKFSAAFLFQPLDQATCVHNCLEQLDTHTRTACLETGSAPPNCQERTILLSSVLVQARPLHLAFSLAYIEHFAFSLPSELEASLKTLLDAAKLVESTPERRCHSARKRREVSLEQLIGLTDELENRYGRHGREPESDRPRFVDLDQCAHPSLSLRSTRELERERLAERLELSSREVTQHEEAEWRCLDSTNPTQGWPTPRQGNLLQRFHSHLLCSGDA